MTKVEERKFVTAAHCMTLLQVDATAMFAAPAPQRSAGARFEVTTARSGTANGVAGWRALTIEDVAIPPSWFTRARPSNPYTWPGLIEHAGAPPDIAIVTVVEKTPNIPTLHLTRRRLPAPGSRIVKVGAGCESFDTQYDPRFRIEWGRSRVLTEADFAALRRAHDRELRWESSVRASYVWSHTDGFYPTHTTSSNDAGICPGASGGPVLLGGKIIGVNSSYFERSFDWTTRFDAPAAAALIADHLCAPDRPPWDEESETCKCPNTNWDDIAKTCAAPPPPPPPPPPAQCPSGPLPGPFSPCGAVACPAGSVEVGWGCTLGSPDCGSCTCVCP